MTKEIDAVAEAMKEQISKMMQSFKLPDVDMTAIVEGPRGNQFPNTGAVPVAKLSKDGQKISLFWRL